MEMTQPGFFDLSERYLALSECNDPLERLNGAIDWSIFQRDLPRLMFVVPDQILQAIHFYLRAQYPEV